MRSPPPIDSPLPARTVLCVSCALLLASAAAALVESRTGFSAWLDSHRLHKIDAGGRAVFFCTAAFEGASLAWLVLAWFVAGGDGRRAFRTLLALLLAGLVGWAVKESVIRDRPNGADLDSFPSGHVAGAAAVAAGLWSRRSSLNLLLVLAVAAGAFTRISTGKHFPSDALGGAAVGTLCAFLAARIPILSRVRATRTQVLAVLLAAVLATPWLSERSRDFFAGTAPGILLLVAALALGRRPARTGIEDGSPA